MKIRNSFAVDLPPAEAWDVLMDVEGIVPCVPGAELVEMVDEHTFKGKVSVRLGPVALTFAGKVSFEDIDVESHKAKLRAQGQDEKGRGGANATVVYQLHPEDGGSRVDIETDLMLSGSVAQYGRAQGVITQVAEEIIGQFASCLADRLRANADASEEATPAVKPISLPAFFLAFIWKLLVHFFSRITGRK